MTELWTGANIATATDGQLMGEFTVSGLSIDTRSLQKGDLFVALKDVRDGHDFIANARAAGAAAVLSERPLDGPGVQVADTSIALRAMAAAARDRSAALRIGVTGSVGKTSVKDALHVMMSVFGTSHKSLKSFNNHYGVPITLATLPQETDFAILEMGMNHAGELRDLSALAKPNIALINNVEAAHLAQFNSIEDIADAKAEIMEGVVAGGTLILNGDNPHTPHVRAKADALDLHVLTFGHSDQDDVTIVSANSHASGGNVRLRIGLQQIDVTLMVPGEHWFMNAAACMAVAHAADLPLRKAAMALRKVTASPGRGDTHALTIDGKSITLIDESYNANPASMRAAISAAAMKPGRKLAVLGEMYELGADELALHAELAEPLSDAGFERVFVMGECMRALRGSLPQPLRAGWHEQGETLLTDLKGELRDGDIVLVKGSNASGVGKVAAQLKSEGAD